MSLQTRLYDATTCARAFFNELKATFNVYKRVSTNVKICQDEYKSLVPNESNNKRRLNNIRITALERIAVEATGRGGGGGGGGGGGKYILLAKSSPKILQLLKRETRTQINVLCQGCHWVWGLTHRHAIKEETIVINLDWGSYLGMQTFAW